MKFNESDMLNYWDRGCKVGYQAGVLTGIVWTLVAVTLVFILCALFK